MPVLLISANGRYFLGYIISDRAVFVFWRVAALLLSLGLIFTWGCRTGGDTVAIDDFGVEDRSTAYEYNVYYVQKGDTLYSIGRRFGVSWQDIQRVNNVSAHSLRIGQLLLIPGTAAGGEVGGNGRSRVEGSFRQSRWEYDRRTEDFQKQTGEWWWPVKGSLAYRYGEKVRGFFEPGIGIQCPAGTPVVAAKEGEVICVIYRDSYAQKGWGNVVAIKHDGGFVSWYGQLGSIFAEEGGRVKKGDRIASVGESGASSMAQLAFRLFKDERPVNPMDYLR